MIESTRLAIPRYAWPAAIGGSAATARSHGRAAANSGERARSLAKPDSNARAPLSSVAAFQFLYDHPFGVAGAVSGGPACDSRLRMAAVAAFPGARQAGATRLVDAGLDAARSTERQRTTPPPAALYVPARLDGVALKAAVGNHRLEPSPDPARYRAAQGDTTTPRASSSPRPSAATSGRCAG